MNFQENIIPFSIDFSTAKRGKYGGARQTLSSLYSKLIKLPTISFAVVFVLRFKGERYRINFEFI